MNDARTKKRHPVAMLVLTNVLWGVSFPVMKMTNLVMEHSSADATVDHVGADSWHHVHAAAFLVFVRFAMSLVLLAILFPRMFRTMTGRQWTWGIATGLGFSAGMMLQIMALNEIPASRSGFLTSLTVVFTPVLSLLIYRHAPRRMLVVGVVMALLGTAILTGMIALESTGPRLADDWRGRVGWGDMTTLLAAVIFAGQILMIDRASRSIPTSRLSPGMFLATSVAGLAVFACTSWVGGTRPSDLGTPLWIDWLSDGRFLVLTLVLSMVCTVAAFHLMNTYQPYVTPSEAAIIYALEPLFATLWAMCLPGWLSPWLGRTYASERPGWELVIGGSLVLVGNVLALFPTGTRPAISQKQSADQGRT
jgi:drug/metabolite transporter (DMT)-like permease